MSVDREFVLRRRIFRHRESWWVELSIGKSDQIERQSEEWEKYQKIKQISIYRSELSAELLRYLVDFSTRKNLQFQMREVWGNFRVHHQMKMLTAAATTRKGTARIHHEKKKISNGIRLWLFVIYGERCEEGCEYNFFLHSNSCTIQLIAWNVAKIFYQRKLESERNNIVQIRVYRVFHGIPRTFFILFVFLNMKFERLHNICTLLLSP